jgi:hypothetical protein
VDEQQQEMNSIWKDIETEEKQLGLTFFSVLRDPINIGFALNRIELAKKMGGKSTIEL